MRVNVVRIGNSRGVRIPRAVLKSCHLEGEVELETRGGVIVLRPVRRARAGWEDSFRRMAEAGDDKLVDRNRWPSTRWDREEWTW